MVDSKRVKVIVPDDDVIASRQRDEDERSSRYTAKELRYVAARDCFVITMRSGVIVSMARSSIQEFAAVSSDNLRRVRIGIGGDVIELAHLDIHISVPGLLRDLFGLNVGQRNGGRSRSVAKAAAARENGARGGRPKSSR
jgi:hypothetical protein